MVGRGFRAKLILIILAVLFDSVYFTGDGVPESVCIFFLSWILSRVI